MQITFYPPRTIILQHRGNGEEGLVVINPPLESKRTFLHGKQPFAVLFSQPQEAVGAEKIFANALIIAGPGEYETKDVMVRGVASKNGVVMYAVEDEGMTLAYLGNITQTEIPDDQQEALGAIDILFVPVGGGNTLDSKQAMRLVQEIEPRLVIPIMCDGSGYGSSDAFARGFGSKAERMEKLKISKKDLPSEETRLVILASAS